MASGPVPDDEIVGSLLVSPRVHTWLRKLPRLVLAVGADHLYRVIVKGSGFGILFGGASRPVVGFYTNRIVRARSRLDAAERAFRSVERRWRSLGFELEAGCMPSLVVDHLTVLPERFSFRRVPGFAFFPADSEE